jgi:sarcosine oxidase subunit alpha
MLSSYPSTGSQIGTREGVGVKNRPDDTGQFEISVNGRAIAASAGMSVAAALTSAGIACRTSATGQPRNPLCGMGICFECAATVDGVPLQRTCQLICRPGMEVSAE